MTRWERFSEYERALICGGLVLAFSRERITSPEDMAEIEPRTRAMLGAAKMIREIALSMGVTEPFTDTDAIARLEALYEESKQA